MSTYLPPKSLFITYSHIHQLTATDINIQPQTSTYSDKLIILQLDDVSHANIHPLLILQPETGAHTHTHTQTHTHTDTDTDTDTDTEAILEHLLRTSSTVPWGLKCV